MEFLSSFSQLIKFYPPGYIGPSAAAVPYEILQCRSRITQPGKSRSLTEEEMNVPRMLVKIWEIGDILQYHHIVQKLSDIRELSPPPTFLAYNDVFFTYNAINNALQLFVVRPFFEQGTVLDHMRGMAFRNQCYSSDLLDRWMIQLLCTLDWAHTNGLVLANLSAKNVCLADNGRDICVVDYLPPEMVNKCAIATSSFFKLPKDDHTLTYFRPEEWTTITDFEAVGHLMLQLSIVGHPKYSDFGTFLHKYSIEEHYGALMELVRQNHGSGWMKAIDKMLGTQYSKCRADIMDELLKKIRYLINHSANSFDWGSEINISENQDSESPPQTDQHNLPDSGVLVSRIEQAWEFFQHGDENEFSRICTSMLKLIPADSQSTLRNYHLQIIEKLFDQANRDENNRHNVATLLGGILYADDADKVALNMSFDMKLRKFLEQSLGLPGLTSMLATSLAQIFHADTMDVNQRLEACPGLFRSAFLHFRDWPAFMPVLLCIVQNAARMPTAYCAKTPLIPFLILTMYHHLSFPCELHLCLRLLRRITERSALGCFMVIRFKIAGAVYSPVEVFLRTLKEHGHKIHIHREILLIATRLWSIPEFCELMVEDNWLQVFSKIVSLTEDQALLKLVEQCMAERNLVIVDGQAFRILQEPFIHDNLPFDTPA